MIEFPGFGVTNKAVTNTHAGFSVKLGLDFVRVTPTCEVAGFCGKCG